MKKVALLSAAALMGTGVLTTSTAEARGGGALAAGLIGGIAAGALLGAAVSQAQAGPAYGYAPAYGPDDGYDYPPPRRYRPVRIEEAVPVYERRRMIVDEWPPAHFGDTPAPRRRHRECDRDGDGGW